MSLYEGLSLVLSMFGTMFTVYLGFRQLRQTAPAIEAVPAGPVAYGAPPLTGFGPGQRPAPAPGFGGPPSAYGVAPAPTHAGQRGWTPVSPAPVRGPTYGAPRPQGGQYPVPGWPMRRVRPQSVKAASILLFVAAALQPIALLAYYGIEFAINAEAATTDLDAAGVVDVTVFGIVAVLCGILGILVARGNRVAAWVVWILGVLGVPFSALTVFGLLLTLLYPSEGQDPASLLAVVVIYLIVVSLAIVASAGLLINAKARDFFFKKA
jgi:hypothetical protein